MGLSCGFRMALWHLACFCIIIQTAINNQAQAQQQQKRSSSRITSSRSFGTNVKTSGSNGIDFDCPEEFGYYPHPTDCTQYYVCVFGGALLESCTGGLMYSHELQTCDWPRNVGCEVVEVDSGALSNSAANIGGSSGGTRSSKHQQQQQSINSQHVPSRIRFGSAFSSPAGTTPSPKAAVPPPQYHRQPPQVIQAQVQSLPQHAGTVIGTRGQPKPFGLQEDIAQLYADAHDTLPPVEEEESDRQQRVYRGQPSTVSQVQRDRDGIIHQASINAIPNHGKIGSYAFGSQYRRKSMKTQFLDRNELDMGETIEKCDEIDNEVDNEVDNKVVEHAHKRVKRDLNALKNDDTKIVYNTGETLKTETTNTKTLKELRAIDFNIGETLKTDEYQRTLEKPNIAVNLNPHEKLTKPTEDLKPLELMSNQNNDETLVRSAEEATDKREELGADNRSYLDSEEDMQNSVMEIVIQILEKLKSNAELAVNSTITTHSLDGAANGTSGKSDDELQVDPILETLNSIAALIDVDYADGGVATDANTVVNDTEISETRMRNTRQLHHYFNGRARFQIQNMPGTHYRSVDNGPFVQMHQQLHSPQSQPQLTSFSFGAFNPFLSPPTTVSNYNQLSPGYQVYGQQHQPQQQPLRAGPKPKYIYTAALNPPPPPQAPPSELSRPLALEDDFHPMAANYYRDTTTPRPTTSTTPRRPNLFNNPELIPYILQALREYQEQRKQMKQNNFQYFHLGSNEPATTNVDYKPPPHYQSTKAPTKVTLNSQFSTMGGYYNNNENSNANNKQRPPRPQTDLEDYKSTIKYPSKLVSQYSIIDNYIPSTTESSYFKYNLLTNQKIKAASYSTTSTTTTSKPLLLHLAGFQAGLAPARFTTPPPSTSNIDVVSAPHLKPSNHYQPQSATITTTNKTPKYNIYAEPPENSPYANSSTNLPENFPLFTKVPKLKSEVRPVHPSRKPALTIQFNVPEFVASLQSSDLANMNPQVVNMIKYFKQLNTPQPKRRKPTTTTAVVVSKPITIQQQYENRVPITTEVSNRQRPTVTPTRRTPTLRGYEDFIKSIPNQQTHKLNSFGQLAGRPFIATVSTTRSPYHYDDGEYDERREQGVVGEEEEEDESLGSDTDDEIMPPSQMPPYMPMSETMAPPRPHLMPFATTTAAPSVRTPSLLQKTTIFSAHHEQTKPTRFNTGFYEATTTRRPFSVMQFQQFYPPTTDTKFTKQQQQHHPQQPNQIPSFINFPSDIFQEFKQRLPPKPQLGATTAPTLTNQNNIRFTTAKPSTTSTQRTTKTTTRASTTTTPSPTFTTTSTTTTTATTERIRYTVRPSNHRNRGQSKWQSSSSSSGSNNSNNRGTNSIIDANNNSYNKNNKTEFGTQNYRKRPAATPTTSALGSLNLNVNMHLDMADGGQRDIEYQQQQPPPPPQQSQPEAQQPQQPHYQPASVQQQQPQQQSLPPTPVRQQTVVQQSTYRPLDVLTTPTPIRETYNKVQKKPAYNDNQHSLIYNTEDYDEDLIAQIEQDNVYDQPTRPPTRTNSNNNRNRGSSTYTGQERDTPTAVTSNRGTHPPRTRPTLKPSGTIVSKAQEFVDIYRYPPSRPEPLYPQPTPDKAAAKCRKDVCLLPDCACGGKDIPGDLPVETVPQIVLITFDDSVNDLNKQLYTDLFEKGRVNPNGCPITATFYVSHEWTDYSQVQNLYSDGHEMASHTVSHSFGEQFSQKKWTREIAGQREILAAYGGVKLSDVRGMRAPFLSVGGNKMYKMLYDSNFTYDSSLPVYENRPPSWPYTFDYKIFHDCMIPPCPTRSYPGVWQVPMVMWQDLNGGRCSMGDACSNPSESDGVYKMIMKNFERHYTTNRAPFGLYYHAAWFTQPHHKEGFIKFLDAINQMNDVWIVTNWQMLQWVRDPTPLSRINSFQPFQCNYTDRPKRCNNPKVCNLWHKSGVRYMKTCQPCPDIYPWTGKTGIRSSRVDNEIEDSTA